MDDADVCDSWEQMEENSDILEKRLEKLRLKGTRAKEPTVTESESGGDGSARLNGGAEPSFPQFRILSRNEAKIEMDKKISQPQVKVELDSTTQESLRTQYVAPEPKLKILSRPKASASAENGTSAKNKKAQVTKTLQQREQEYAEARMRILGDVRFHEEEHEAALEAAMSPAEILKLKISEAMLNEPTTLLTSVSAPASARSDTSLPSGQSDSSDSNSTAVPGSTSTKTSKKKTKVDRVPNPAPLRDFPLSKVESDRIVRQPRGPDVDGSTGFALKR